jgi:uncharacterized BrkB/YihY/UPF0761 family membrane protein
MKELDTLIVIQLIYIVVLFFTIRASRRQRQKAIFHWAIAGAYMVTLFWLIGSYIGYAKNKDGGGGGISALGTYSILIPGILVFISQFVYQVRKGMKTKI